MARRKEILKCLELNCKNKYIDEIYLFLDSMDTFPDDISFQNQNKIKFKVGYEKPTFNEMFKILNSLYRDNIIILANLDVFFDKTLQYVKEFENWENTVMAITRWEYDGMGSSRYIGWDYSQDSWCWRSPLNLDDMDCEFTMGNPGCDNRLAYELGKNYNVINPCKTIRCNHYHVSNYRTYTPGDLKQTIDPPHVRVKPISLKNQ